MTITPVRNAHSPQTPLNSPQQEMIERNELSVSSG
jgi:hypothetical protein